MAFGGFNKQGTTAPMAEINMVPLIDVMLVLLVIFILTAPLLTHAVKVELPRATSNQNKMPPQRIEIAVDDKGTLYWDGEVVAEATLDERMQAAGKAVTDPEQAPELQFRFDRGTQYETVARIMSSAARAGLTKLGFVSTPASSANR
jgi:biopolymer transport protein ExbD